MTHTTAAPPTVLQNHTYPSLEWHHVEVIQVQGGECAGFAVPLRLTVGSAHCTSLSLQHPPYATMALPKSYNYDHGNREQIKLKIHQVQYSVVNSCQPLDALKPFLSFAPSTWHSEVYYVYLSIVLKQKLFPSINCK